ncbi:MAG: metallophosphoesterase [Ramlibacter sp.]|jgi:predicted MPP superfamily phosphohydrolase|nr:metallophosphoesterase [Ramlibacter sp.]
MPIYLLSALLHLYVGWRILPALGAWPLAQALLGLVLVASTVLLPLGLMARRHVRGPWADRLAWAGLVGMGLFSSLFVLTVLRDVALLLAVIAFAWRPAALPVAALTTWSAVAVPLLAALATAVGFWNARRTAAVVRVDVPIARLPAALHGFTVAQITDVHVGPTIRRGYLQAIVARVNALGADMVAITGDLVDGKVSELAAHVAPLSQLRSRHGSFFVTGNHEYYSGAQAWMAELRRLGVRVLLNEHVVLDHAGPHGSAALLVAGVADYTAHHFDPAHKSDPQAALRGAPAHARVRLLLAHQPRSAMAAADAGFDLQLSGHTHGGQFWPWNHFVRLQQPFTAGLHKLKDLWVYTSRGTGYWGPPKRFGAPSEITLVRLVPA